MPSLQHASYYVSGAFIIAFASVIFQKMNETQPTPYLDEVFHIPQTKAFCNGSYSKWDPKITTLPGTYVAAAITINTLNSFGWIRKGCTDYNLRMFNMIIGIKTFYLIRLILAVYMKGTSEWKIALSAVNISMFPVLYFFNFLFYTDVTSTFWLLMMHLMFLKGYYSVSSVFGGFAIFTRQTNVVWVAWHGMLIGFNALEMAFQSGPSFSSNSTVGKISKNKRSRTRRNYPQEIKDLAYRIVHEVLKEMPSLRGYIICISLFVLFVIINGGIVVGDKSAHQASFNIPQLGYFTIVYGLFCIPFLAVRFKSTLFFMLKHWIVVTIATALMFLTVHYNTVAHPYLLADNRHYPFYFWKRLIQSNPCVRYLLVPWYIFVWSFIFNNIPDKLAKHKYGLTLFICTVTQLVPQLLLEFRYFIPIYIFSRIVMPKPTWSELICEFFLCTTINLIAIRMFLYTPFYWEGSKEVQRFMW